MFIYVDRIHRLLPPWARGFDDLVDYLTSFSNEGKIGMMVPKLQRRELVKS